MAAAVGVLLAVTGGVVAGPRSPASASPPVSAIGLTMDTDFGDAKTTSSVLLDEQLWLNAGETRRLWGQVDAKSTTSPEVQYDAGIECSSDATGQQSGIQSASAKNYVGPGDVVLAPSLLFTAPTAGSYTCNLWADAQGVLKAMAPGTWLTWDTQDQGAAGWWQNPECDSPGTLTTCTYLGGPSPVQSYLLDTDQTPFHTWTAADNALTANVRANVELTTCHKSASCQPRYHADNNGSTVASHVEAVQLDALGGVCNVTQSADITSRIDIPTHHYNIPYTLFNVPVLPSCGSRQFQVRVSMRLVSGDPVKIDGTRSDPAGILPPEVETYAFMTTSTTGPTTTVPNVIGLTQSCAVNALSSAQLSVGAVNHVVSDAPQNTVIAPQNAVAGTVEPAGSPVYLTVSLGNGLPAGAQNVRLAFHGSDDFLWQSGADGWRQSANGLRVAAGTSPAVAALGDGGFITAFQADGTGDLWTVDACNVGHDTGIQMAAGTSPAVAALPGAGYEIVYKRASDGLLREIGADGVERWVANGLGMAPNTSPAVVALSTGGIEIAFQANGSGDLWLVGTNNVGYDTALPMPAGTSPAMTAMPGGTFEIVFQRSVDGLLWELGTDGLHRASNGLGIQPGTSPAIAATPGGSFEVAFQSGGSLWAITPDNVGHNTLLHVALDTSPGITALPAGGFDIGYKSADDGLLWELIPDGTVHRSANGLGVAADTRIAMA